MTSGDGDREPAGRHTGGSGPEPVGGDLPPWAEAVLDVVDAIPAGRVLAYGDVAELAGVGGPRLVGTVMSRYGGLTSWWRVVRASGDPPPGLQDRALGHWREEGTPLRLGRGHPRVDMRGARWRSGPL